MFTVFGWLLMLVVALYVGWAAASAIIVTRGFTGRTSWIGIALLLASIAGAITLLHFAPFRLVRAV